MPRGIFPQVLTVLTVATPTVAQLEEALAGYGPLTRIEPGDTSHHGGPGVQFACGQGRMLVDILDHPWPDGMGNPETEADLFGAWVTGFYGDAYPGSLSRAAMHCWVWDGAAQAVEEHTGFLRLRSCHVKSGAPDETLLPPNYDPVAELDAMHDLVESLSGLGTCLFNPAGEVLRPLDWVQETRTYNREQGLPDLDVWTNVRLWNLPENWKLMDTIGMGQLFLPDLETVSYADYDPNDVSRFLLNLSLYLLTNGDVFSDGDTTEGPGGLNWNVRESEAMVDPPRAVLGWLPQDGRPLPQGI